NDLVAVADREGMRGRAGSAVALAAVAADLAVVVAEAGTGVEELTERGRAIVTGEEGGRAAVTDVADPGRAVDLQIEAATVEARVQLLDHLPLFPYTTLFRSNDLVAVADREGMRGRAGSAVALAAVAADLAVVVAEAGTGVAELADRGRAVGHVEEVGRAAVTDVADPGRAVDLQIEAATVEARVELLDHLHLRLAMVGRKCVV